MGLRQWQQRPLVHAVSCPLFASRRKGEGQQQGSDYAEMYATRVHLLAREGRRRSA